MEYSPPELEISEIVDEVKSQGLFDQLRRDCLSDLENEPTYRTLKDQVDRFCKSFLSREEWHPNLDKTELRNRLREQLLRADFVIPGVTNLVDRLVRNSKLQKDLYPAVEQIIYSQLGLPQPTDSQTASESITNGGNDSRRGAMSASEPNGKKEYGCDSLDQGPSKRLRSDKDGDSLASDTGPPSQLHSDGDISTYETPVQDELNAPPVDPSPSRDGPPAELSISDELSVRWHVTELSPNPDTDGYITIGNEYVAHEHVLRSAVRDIEPDEVESPAHERL